jgi:hypothetical protein
MSLSYEDMRRLHPTEEEVSFDNMCQEAVANRGGHCCNCQHCTKLDAKRPSFIQNNLRSDNLSVTVSCAIDFYRKYPFRKEGSKPEDCPSLQRHLRRGPAL